MSISLLVRCFSPRTPTSGPEEACERILARSRISSPHLRLVCRHARGDLSLEPFFRNAGFDTLLQNRKKRPAVLAAIRSVVAECFLVYQRVDIELFDENRVDSPEEHSVTLEQIIPELPSADHVKFSVRPPLMRFLARGVEARLFAPLPIDARGSATGYFQDIEVLATNESEVRTLVSAELNRDGASFLRWQAVDVDVTTDSGPPRVLTRTGRIFFDGSD